MSETSYEVQLPDGSTAIVTAMPVNPTQLPQPPPGSGLEPQVSTRVNFGGQWAIYYSNELNEGTDPTPEQAIAWELEAIREGRTDDRV